MIASDNSFNELTNFKFWCQKVLPLVYDDSISYYEVLCKLVAYLNQMIDNQNADHATLVQQGFDIETLKSEMLLVQQELEKFINGDYTNKYIESLANWIDSNLQQLVGRIVKYIFFGLTDDGYFVAYIPQSWNFINFDTIIQPENPLYGHLLLQW